ncbi:MAG: 50S ribosomal protein L23 [Candidatus Pacearchaeota archaeon]
MIKRARATEKAIRLIESENTIVIETDSNDTKETIKKEFERMFNVKVERINIINKGKKKIAYVKLNKNNNAMDLAAKIGVI